MVDIFLEDVRLSKHVSFDQGMEEQRHFPCLCYPEVCQMRGPPQRSWVLKWGCWPELCQPPPWHCHATLQVSPHGLPRSLLPGSSPALPCKGADLWKTAIISHLELLQEYCSFLRYMVCLAAVNVLACLSRRARRTGHPKSAHLVVLAALKIDKKLGWYAILYNKLQRSPSAKSKGDWWSAVSGSN